MKLLFLLFISACLVHAQETEFNFKKPGPKDFAYEYCSFDKDADAVILNEEALLTIHNEVALIQIKRRIKILTENGKNEAVIQIPFYSGPQKIEQINSLKAVTVNGSSASPIILEVDKKDFHEVDLNEFWKEIRFTFPSVKKGSILEYSYVFETKNLMFIESWEFQHELPTERSYFSLMNESGHEFDVLIEGKRAMIQKNNNAKQFRNLELTDIPSFSKIDHVYNVKDHTDKISFQNKFSPVSWKGLVREKLNDLNQFKRAGAVKQMADEIHRSASEEETVANIANYVDRNFAWNGYHGQWPHKNINEIIRDKNGNSAELNFLFWLLTQELGLNSELLMVSSRPNGKMKVIFPFLGQFDNLVTTVHLKNGKIWIIDASDFDVNQPSYFPLKIANYHGLMLNENANFVKIMMPVSEFTFRHHYKEEKGKMQLTENNKWNGYFNEKTEDVPSFFRPQHIFSQALVIKEVPQKEFREGFYFNKQLSDAEVPDHNIVTLTHPLEDFIENLLISEENREIAVEYPFPLEIKGNVILEIPYGYDATFPEDKGIKMKDNVFYIQAFKSAGNSIVATYQFYMGQNEFENNDIQDLKKFMDTVMETSRQNIILKKKH